MKSGYRAKGAGFKSLGAAIRLHQEPRLAAAFGQPQSDRQEPELRTITRREFRPIANPTADRGQLNHTQAAENDKIVLTTLLCVNYDHIDLQQRLQYGLFAYTHIDDLKNLPQGGQFPQIRGRQIDFRRPQPHCEGDVEPPLRSRRAQFQRPQRKRRWFTAPRSSA